MQQHQFVSDAAHELKTAVAVAKSSVQLLTMRHRTAMEYEAGLERCQADCERMEEIVAKMLTLARVESQDESKPLSYATNLIDCVRAGRRAACNRGAGRRVCASPSSGDEAATVDVAPEQLQLLCSNLILNALQHSSEGRRGAGCRAGRQTSA